jgi:hypothetical protein
MLLCGRAQYSHFLSSPGIENITLPGVKLAIVGLETAADKS